MEGTSRTCKASSCPRPSWRLVLARQARRAGLCRGHPSPQAWPDEAEALAIGGEGEEPLRSPSGAPRRPVMPHAEMPVATVS